MSLRSRIDALATRVASEFQTVRGEIPAEGASAYEVAVANGFSGAEQEWLDSLKGDPPPVEVVASPPASPAAGTFYVVTG